jgi:hypothetical protein
MLWRGSYQRVVAVHDTWRIDDEWWRDEIARRYFVVELESGRRVTIFHDLVRDLWYQQTYEAPKAAAPKKATPRAKAAPKAAAATDGAEPKKRVVRKKKTE